MEPLLRSKQGPKLTVFVGLLAYKVWNVTRRTFQYRSSDGLAPVLRVAIESGAIYTVTMSAGLALFLLKSEGMLIIIDVVRISASPFFSSLPLVEGGLSEVYVIF